MAYSIIQNTTFLTAAAVTQKVISFVYFTLIAGFLEVGDTGQYFFALAFASIFTVLADFGLGPVLTRESARAPVKRGDYASTVFSTKLVFGIIAYLTMIGFARLLRYNDAQLLLLAAAGGLMFFDNLHSAFYSVLRADRNLLPEAVGMIGSQLLTLILGTGALIIHAPPVVLILCYVVPSILNTIYAWRQLRRTSGIKVRLSLDKDILKKFLRLAVPFALAGFIGRLYIYSDSILLSKFLPPAELGWWSVPFKITVAFQFIPSALAASVYPVMSGLFITDTAEINRLFGRALRYLGLIIFPLTGGLLIAARPLILTLYGARYLPSAPILQLLAVAAIFGYLSFLTGALLNATNQQRLQTMLIALALAVSVILNIFLIPRFGLVGAGLSAIVSSACLGIGGFVVCFQRKLISIKDFGRALLPTLWPAAVMVGVVAILIERLPLWLLLGVAGLTYSVLLFISGALSIQLIMETYRKLWNQPTTL